MILVFLEHNSGEIDNHNLQTLTFANNLSKEKAVPFEVVSFGDADLTETVRKYGATKNHIIKTDTVGQYAAEARAQSLGQLAEATDTSLLLAPASVKGNELLAYVGAQKSLTLVTQVISIQSNSDITRSSWAGGLLEEVQVSQAMGLFTLAANVCEATEAPADACEACEFSPTIDDKYFRAQMQRLEESVEEGANLKTASLVIGGGRGVGSAEGFEILDKLGEKLNAVVGGSRVTTNNGWRPHAQQIGLTGNNIAPKLYIACGISGAIQHMAGCKNAKNILAINTDEDAPIFSHADYGIVGDLHKVVPAIIEELQ